MNKEGYTFSKLASVTLVELSMTMIKSAKLRAHSGETKCQITLINIGKLTNYFLNSIYIFTFKYFLNKQIRIFLGLNLNNDKAKLI